MLDEIAEAELAKVFDEFVFDPQIEECLQHKLARWKQQELARLGSCLQRGGEALH